MIESADVTILADGRAIRIRAGSSVAAALLSAGVTAFRRTATGESRAPLCGMGICYECRVTIEGVAHQRACLVTAAEGMVVQTANSPST